VIPPDLRPLVAARRRPLRDLGSNDLYRRVINRNNRLKRLMERTRRHHHPEREALAPGGPSTPSSTTAGAPGITGPNKRPLKSLSDMLKGKSGPVPAEPSPASASTTPAAR